MTIGLSRRQVLATMGAAALAVEAPRTASAAAAAPVQPRAHGRVIRRDGNRDAGVGGVMVSNGRDVVVTARDGTWSLPQVEARDIFVIKPPQYRIVGAGSVPPAAGNAIPNETIVFELAAADEPDRFDVVLVTDTQPESHDELNFVRDDIFGGMLGLSAAFGIHHGDVVGDALDLFPRHQELLRVTGMPWHHCVGNHDIDREAHGDDAARHTWRRTFGPRWYAFQHAKAVFFILDNVEYFGAASGRYRGRLGDEQLGFVAQVLAQVPQDHLVVLSMHIPLRCYLAADSPSDTTADYDQLLRLLSGRPHSVSFSGHLHATEHHYLPLPGTEADQRTHHHHVLTAGSGSWWSGPRDARGIPCADSTDGSPNGFHILRVDGHRYVTDFVPAVGKRPAPLRAMLHAPADGPQGRALLVNVFDGGPRTVVSYRLDGGLWSAMQCAPMRDPLICRMLQGDTPRKPWVEATSSSHIWTAPLPDSFGAGPLKVELRVTDEYGRVHEAPLILEPRFPGL